MKETSFFKTKANYLKQETEKIKLIDYNFSEDNAEYNNQKEKLDYLLIQTKLMLSEFDNSEIFIENINKKHTDNTDALSLFSNQPLKTHILKNLTLFIEFLEEYRS